MIKKMFLSLAACSLIAAGAQAQQYLSLGPVIGFGHSGVSNGDMEKAVDGSIQSKFNPSFKAGIGLIYAKHAHWGFGAEVVYAQDGFKKQVVTNSAPTLDMDLTKTVGYIRVPLRVYYFFGQYQQTIRPKVYLGPSFGFKISEKEKFEGNNELTKELLSMGEVNSEMEFNSFDLGIQAGVGVNITLSKAMWLNVDLNYTQGLLDAVGETEDADFDTGTNMSQRLGLQVGVLFGL